MQISTVCLPTKTDCYNQALLQLFISQFLIIYDENLHTFYMGWNKNEACWSLKHLFIVVALRRSEYNCDWSVPCVRCLTNFEY